MKKKTNTAAKSAAQEKPFIGYATFEICGTVTDIYNGKNADYVTVRVYDSEGMYYTDIQVTCEKDVVEIGDKLTFSGEIKRYYSKKRAFRPCFPATTFQTKTKRPLINGRSERK